LAPTYARNNDEAYGELAKTVVKVKP